MLNSSAGAGHEWPRGRKRWLPARALRAAVVDEDVDDDDDDDEQSNGDRVLCPSLVHLSHTRPQKRRYRDLFSVRTSTGLYSSRFFFFRGSLAMPSVERGTPT